MKRALITGVTGQDGSYLSEILLADGYEVHGIKRRGSSLNTGRIDHLIPNERFVLHYGDLCDAASLNRIIRDVKPDEIYNLGAQSHVAVSFEMPEYTFDTVANGTLRLLEAMRQYAPKARMYQASSSEMFGNQQAPQGLTTPFDPQSPYAVAKVAAHHFCKHYRQAYGLWVVCGILFNHESPRRGETFVTRKITRGLARIRYGLQHELVLGNLEAKRDWGHAEDYMGIVAVQLRHPEPMDFVIGTGVTTTVKQWLHACLSRVGSIGEGRIVYDPRYVRPAEVHELRADCGVRTVNVARRSWYDLVGEMMAADLKAARDEAELRELRHAKATGR